MLIHSNLVCNCTFFNFRLQITVPKLKKVRSLQSMMRWMKMRNIRGTDPDFQKEQQTPEQQSLEDEGIANMSNNHQGCPPLGETDDTKHLKGACPHYKC